MSSLRKVFQITLQEEEMITKEVLESLSDLIAISMPMKIDDTVEKALNMSYDSRYDDSYDIHYSLSFGAGNLKMFLERIRRGEKAKMEFEPQESEKQDITANEQAIKDILEIQADGDSA